MMHNMEKTVFHLEIISYVNINRSVYTYSNYGFHEAGPCKVLAQEIGYSTIFCVKKDANYIIMSCHIICNQTSIYKQGVVSKLSDFKSDID